MYLEHQLADGKVKLWEEEEEVEELGKEKAVCLFVVLAVFVGTIPVFVAKAGQCFPWALWSLEGRILWAPGLLEPLLSVECLSSWFE